MVCFHWDSVNVIGCNVFLWGEAMNAMGFALTLKNYYNVCKGKVYVGFLYFINSVI